MNLQEALNSLHLAVQELAKAVVIDDKTPLGSALGLAEVSSLVGTGGENPEVRAARLLGSAWDFPGRSR